MCLNHLFKYYWILKKDDKLEIKIYWHSLKITYILTEVFMNYKIRKSTPKDSKYINNLLTQLIRDEK